MEPIYNQDPADECQCPTHNPPRNLQCPQCGSRATENVGPLILGCYDCGYEAPDPVDDPVFYHNVFKAIHTGSADLYQDMRRGK